MKAMGKIRKRKSTTVEVGGEEYSVDQVIKGDEVRTYVYHNQKNVMTFLMFMTLSRFLSAEEAKSLVEDVLAAVRMREAQEGGE